MILNQAQAKAIYDAMMTMNNVGGEVACDIPLGKTQVKRIFVYMNGYRVARVCGFQLIEHEDYGSQGDFAIAYNV